MDQRARTRILLGVVIPGTIALFAVIRDPELPFMVLWPAFKLLQLCAGPMGCKDVLLFFFSIPLTVCWMAGAVFLVVRYRQRRKECSVNPPGPDPDAPSESN
jgi:hypothetical protein